LPPLLPANQPAYTVYSLCSTQLIMGMSGPVDLNHQAIWEVIDRFELPNPQNTFLKTVVFGRAVIAAQNKQREDEK